MYIIHKQILSAKKSFAQALHLVFFDNLSRTSEIRILADPPLRTGVNLQREDITKQRRSQHDLTMPRVAALMHFATREHLAERELGLSGELHRARHVYHSARCRFDHGVGGLQVDRQRGVCVAMSDSIGSTGKRSGVIAC